ncbi:ABC transporter ATP-binding protein [Salipaludibacillus sp. LMS25]|jgi:ABC-type multidrug transport system ATPase subunit|uniref:ABC transporter ATP-binding protein n=1 Tax=Salipaludibacillus sp. LMS25 TaxID=2924031 RepID=UPI0020D0A235|nr:ABC transporter ATP-binding protein [Salipaludibacillus sp. LMS25]UTR16908.1 ABC transporter ATP-binding protein [Salipaludibacillus sp. LMS25]
MSNLIIETKNLTKEYKNTKALSRLNLKIEKGRTIGLLGKNGAGKTTLNKLITGLIFPTEGTLHVFGEVPQGGSKKIGYLSENIAMYPHLNARENLEITILQEGRSPKKAEILRILEMVSIDDTKKKVKDFSLGMKRRLQVAMTVLANDRELLILDEPTNGLDLDGVLWLKNMIIQLRDEGRTILLSSHSILQMEDVLTDYIILHKGGVVDSGGMSNLSDQVLKIELNVMDIKKAISCFDKNDTAYDQQGSSLTIRMTQEYTHYLKALYEIGVFPISYSIKRKSLVDRFHQFTGGDTVA